MVLTRKILNITTSSIDALIPVIVIKMGCLGLSHVDASTIYINELVRACHDRIIE